MKETIVVSESISPLPADWQDFGRKLEKSIRAVQSWVEEHDYKGYDPADGNSSFLHVFTFGNTFLQRVLQQVVLRSPWHIRPMMGVRPLPSPHARGYMVSGYLRLHRQTGDPVYRALADSCLDWLTQHKSPFYEHCSWGNQFHYATRGGKRRKYEPIIVWTSMIGHAFLDAYEDLGDRRRLEVAESACKWMMSLPREKTSTGTCLSYVAYKQASIHNANMLGAAFLAHLASINGDSHAMGVAREAMLYSCSRMKPDGSWLYAEGSKYHWIDNFHTGYNLESLKQYMDSSGDRQFEDHLHRGLKFFKDHFFEPDGAPKYFHNQKYPVDIQSAAQAIETLAAMSDIDPDCLPLGRKVAEWTIHNMQAPDGHFYYRDIGWKKVVAPMIHWGQGTMFKALVSTLGVLKKRGIGSANTATSARV